MECPSFNARERSRKIGRVLALPLNNGQPSLSVHCTVTGLRAELILLHLKLYHSLQNSTSKHYLGGKNSTLILANVPRLHFPEKNLAVRWEREGGCETKSSFFTLSQLVCVVNVELYPLYIEGDIRHTYEQVKRRQEIIKERYFFTVL